MEWDVKTQCYIQTLKRSGDGSSRTVLKLWMAKRCLEKFQSEPDVGAAKSTNKEETKGEVSAGDSPARL
jgi:hypothetical protein